MEDQDPLELKNLGNSFVKSGDFWKAIEAYTTALNKSQDDKSLTFLLYSNRSYSNLILGNLCDALFDANKAIEADPEHFKGYLRRSNVFAEYSLLVKSIDDLNKSISLSKDENDKKVLNNRLKCLENQKQINEKDPEFMEKQYFFMNMQNFEIDLQAAKKIGELFFDKKGLSKESAQLVLPKLKEVFGIDLNNTSENILRIQARKVNILGNIDGDIGKLYAFFDKNGYPSKENVYIINGNFIGQNDHRIIFILFMFKLAEPNSIYFTRGAYDTSSTTPNYLRVAKFWLKTTYGDDIQDGILEIIDKFPLCLIVNNKYAVMSGGPPINSQNSVWGQFSQFISPESNGINQIDDFPMFSFGEYVTNQFLSENNCECLICSNRPSAKGFDILMNGKYINSSFAKKNPNIPTKSGYVIIIDQKIESHIFEYDLFPLEVHYDKDKGYYEGIFYNMRKYTNKPPNENGLVSIFSTRTFMNQFVYTIDSSMSFFDYMTFPEPNSWILLDFKEKKIKLENYSIESAGLNINNDHLKSWKVEASDDYRNWIVIDERKGVNDLNGPYYQKVFDIKDPKFYRIIKLTQMERNHRGNLNLCFHHIEFYGIVQ